MKMDWGLERRGTAGRAPREHRQSFHNKILFCDMIDFSQREPLWQGKWQDVLNEAVDGALGDLDCDREKDLIALPTGGGMLLNFLAPAPDIHLRAALTLLQHWPASRDGGPEAIGLRIGLNTDVDTWGLDINGQRNVVGNGVNLAQRIMDLGGHGQVLMHDRVRTELSQTSIYAPKLDFRGTFQIRHGVNVPVAQFIDPTLPFVSDARLEPSRGAAPTEGSLSLSDFFRQVRDERVLVLRLGPQDAPNVRPVQDGVEEFLRRHGSLQRLRLRAHWVVGELLQNIFHHAGLQPDEQAELRIDLAHDGMVIETTQPERRDLAPGDILPRGAADESFFQIMGMTGATPHIYAEGDRLVIGLKLPLDEGIANDVTAAPAASGRRQDWQSDVGSVGLVARPVGRIDETTWEAFSHALLEAVKTAKAEGVPLILDLSGVDYMSSRGLRALTMAKREAGEDVAITLAAPNLRMREILAISRYDKLFLVTDHV